MAKKSKDDLAKTRELMAAMLRLNPKPHDEMKAGKKRAAKGKKRPGK